MQENTLQAAVNRIIPADEYSGGWEAGVGDFLARRFAEDPALTPLYANGLARLESLSETEYSASFAELNPERQDALLTIMEQNDPDGFFRAFARHCQEGFYADPGNGGNRDKIAWRMIGFEVTA